ncbi:MAG: bile acid:sodium symporter [Planctomycetes bacterium]|nr:bile acid:sodium symporter [Planctomycetota bacterium]
MLAKLFTTYFWIPAYGMFALGLIAPGDYSAMGWAIPLFLCGILYCSCLKISLAEARGAFGARTLAQVSVMTPMRLVALPLITFGITWVIAPEWAPGVFLASMMPAGFSTVAFTDLYRGNRMLALVVLLVTSAVCPFTVPPLLDWLGEGDARIAWSDIAPRSAYLLALLAIPFAAAQATRAMAPDFVQRHHARWNLGAFISSCILGFFSVAVNRGGWTGLQWSDAIAPFALGCLAVAICIAASLIALAAMRRSDAIAFGCGNIYPNGGLAVAFATQFFPGDARMLLPSLLMQAPIIAGISAYGWWLRRGALARDTDTGTGTEDPKRA